MRFRTLSASGCGTVNPTPFQFMTGRWGNKTFQSNTSHHLHMDSNFQSPLFCGSKFNTTIPSERWEMKEEGKGKNYERSERTSKGIMPFVSILFDG